MDPRFGPAWVAFGHKFALEGEHDHAVTAYLTCEDVYRVSPGGTSGTNVFRFAGPKNTVVDKKCSLGHISR